MKKIVLIVFIFLLTSLNIQAAHVLGGKFSYRKIDEKTLEIKIELERDCAGGGAPFESTLFIGMYSNSTHLLVKNLSLPRVRITPVLVSLDCGGMKKCVEIGTYTTRVSLNDIPFDSEGYYLHWERCCMADFFRNLNNPASSPFSAVIELPSGIVDTNSTYYSSPVSNVVFNPVLCINKSFKYSLNYTDEDGDSLAYRFIKPIAGGYTSVSSPGQNTGPKPYDLIEYAPGYDEYQFLDATDTPYLDPITGEISFTPTEIGDYVFGYAVDEFRNGKRIGSIYHQSIISTYICDNIIIQQPENQYASLNAKAVFKLKHNTPNAKYQWQEAQLSAPFVNIPGATTDSLIINKVDSTMLSKKYRCVVNAGDCIEYSNEVFIKLLNTGILFDQKKSLNIYPNPSNSTVYLAEGNYAAIHVYSLNGVFIKTSDLKNAVDISDLENGMYLLKVEYQEGGKTGYAKILKME